MGKHILTLIGGLAAVAVQGASLLSNPGFESNPAGETQTLPGWTAYGANSYGETGASQAHGGTNYLKTFQAFTGVVNYNGVYQDYISGPGAGYVAEGWVCPVAGDLLAGQNAAWVEVSFRDANANVLALYRSAVVATNTIATGFFPAGQWSRLAVTNQCDPGSYQITNTSAQLTAPAGTRFLRCQIVFQGDAHFSGGSLYFDDLNLAQTGGAPYGNMNIVWTDEFNGTAINTNVWTFDQGSGGWGNNELECYTSRTNNASVADGFLHLTGRAEAYQGASYTSARIKSQGLFSCTYGRIEWRARMPAGTGCWPALWLLGTNISTLGWPGCGEIDVMENNGSNPGMVQGSIHSGSDATAIYNFTDGGVITNFHTYTLDWTTNALLFYVDGHLYETQTNWSSSTGSGYPFPFNQPFFLIMNLAIGGNYLNNPTTNAINAGTVFPSEVLVDYVRIYNVTDPLRLAVKQAGSSVLLTWNTNVVCRLQAQTNLLATGAWVPVNAITNSLPISPQTGNAFYRLASP